MLTNGLFFHEMTHLLLASFIAGIFYWRFKKIRLVAVILAVSMFVDLDHLFDYWHFVGSLDIRPFFQGVDYFFGSQKVFVLAHSWELVIFLLFWSWWKKIPLVLAVSLALAGHFLIDQFTYHPSIWGYFLIFRLKHGFSLSAFNGFY